MVKKRLFNCRRCTSLSCVDITIYDGNLNGDALQNEQFQVPLDESTTSSCCKQLQRRYFHLLRTTRTRGIFKIDFNTDSKIVLAVLKRFRGHKTSFKYGSYITDPGLFEY